MEVVFRPKYGWSLIPEKVETSPRQAAQDAAAYRKYFRWMRRERVPELCRPWVMGNDIGWRIPSPVHIELHPLEDTEVSVDQGELSEFATLSGYDEMWPRERSAIAVRKSNWLRLYDVRVRDGFHSMFVPNGNGTIEWHLGWEMEIPEGYYVLFLPTPEIPELEIPYGLLDHNMLTTMSTRTGMSIAVRPRETVMIKRCQPIARIILLHEDSLTMATRYDDLC